MSKFFSANVKELYEKVKIAEKATSTKSTLPILEGIKIGVENGLIKFTGTDLELGIECSVNVLESSDGKNEFVLPAKKLKNIIKELPKDKTVRISQGKSSDNESNQTTAVIECESGKYKIFGFKPDEYPELPEIYDKNVIKIKQSILKEIINQVEISISEDESRPFLTGAMLKLDDLTMVSTDSYRLTYRKDSVIDKEINDIEKDNIIIPKKALQEVKKLLDDEGEATIIISRNQISFKFNEINIISRLIEGQFPNYNQVIPGDNSFELTIDRKDFAGVVKRANLFTESDIVKLNLSEDVCSIVSNDSSVGKGYEELSCEYTGEDMEIALNSKYLLENLKSLTSDKVILKLKGGLSPVTIEPNSDIDYIHVLMPVRKA